MKFVLRSQGTKYCCSGSVSVTSCIGEKDEIKAVFCSPAAALVVTVKVVLVIIVNVVIA